MRTSTQPPTTSQLTLVLSAGILAVSLSAIFIRLADAPGVVVALYRMLLASLLLAPLSARALRKTPLSARTFRYAGLAGVFLGLHFATWITSLSYTTVAASTTLVATTPIWVALFAWIFLKLPPPFTVLLGVLLAVLGAALIGFGDLDSDAGSAPLIGYALALAGAVSAAAYLLLGRSAQRQGLGLQAYIGVAYGVAAVVLLPLPLLFGLSYTAYSAATFGWILGLALVPQLIGHTAYNYAMKHLDPTLVATAILLEPVGASLLALAIFGEVPTWLTLIGALILLSGVAITTRNSRVVTPSRVHQDS
jgi:drug/metabolite transporter (DMT)-like permease